MTLVTLVSLDPSNQAALYHLFRHRTLRPIQLSQVSVGVVPPPLSSKYWKEENKKKKGKRPFRWRKTFLTISMCMDFCNFLEASFSELSPVELRDSQALSVL